MSYDGWVMLRLAEDDVVELEEIGNYTSNVSPMWRHALTEAAGKPLRLSETEGWSCAEAADVLALAVHVMQRDREQLLKLEPANGWGDYEGALKYLGRASVLCGRYAKVAGAYLHWWV